MSRVPRILIADDIPAVGATIKEMIQDKMPADIQLATDGDTLWQLLETAKKASAPFDVVVLDLEMPLKRGEPKLKTFGLLMLEAPEVYERYFAEQTNVIVFTQHSQSEYAHRAGRLGAVDFITKHDSQSGEDGFSNLVEAVIDKLELMEGELS